MHRWFSSCAAALGIASAQAGQVSVAVAANFAAPMQKLAAAFEQDTGHQAVLALGSTGRFFAQIKNGAPFQVLLAADSDTPARLEREGAAVPGTRRTYAIGTLVLWSRQPALVDDQGAVLRGGGFTRIALADPKLAPYGAAAAQVLEALALSTALAPKMVQGDNVAQTYQFIATGNAELGFVAMAQVFADGKLQQGSAWRVPAHLHSPLRQDAVLLMPGKGQAAAVALMAYLGSDRARAIISSFGYRF